MKGFVYFPIETMFAFANFKNGQHLINIKDNLHQIDRMTYQLVQEL